MGAMGAGGVTAAWEEACMLMGLEDWGEGAALELSSVCPPVLVTGGEGFSGIPTFDIGLVVDILAEKVRSRVGMNDFN